MSEPETSPTVGQPISLEQPTLTPTEQIANARQLGQEAKHMSALKQQIGEFPSKWDTAPNIAPLPIGDNAEIRRQVEVARREKLAESRGLNRGANDVDINKKEKKWQELEQWDRERSMQNQNIWEKLLMKLGVTETREERLKAGEQYVKELFASTRRALNEQDSIIRAAEEEVLNNPELLEKVIEHAYEEAQIIQRIALGRAIGFKTGGIAGTQKEQLRKYADLYNQGKFEIKSEDYEEASTIYGWLVNSLVGENRFERYKQQRAAHFFSPARQVRRGVDTDERGIRNNFPPIHVSSAYEGYAEP